jgi:hypothetical protein
VRCGEDAEETGGRSGSRNGSLGAQRDDCYHDAIDRSLDAAGSRRLIRTLGFLFLAFALSLGTGADAATR